VGGLDDDLEVAPAARRHEEDDEQEETASGRHVSARV